MHLCNLKSDDVVLKY